MVKKSNIIKKLIICGSAFLCALAACVFSFAPEAGYAYADAVCVSADSVTATYMTGVNGVNAEYSYNQTYVPERGYAKDVKAVFSVTSDYYRFTYTLGGTDVDESVCETPSDGKAVFHADKTGEYNVTCYACSDASGQTELGSCSAAFRNDADAPSLPDIAAMDEWLAVGTVYDAEVDWGLCADAVSGIYGIYYYFVYDDGTKTDAVSVNVLTAGKSLLEIKGKCRLFAVCYDKAGNAAQKVYGFDRYDGVKPPQPSYTVTPDRDVTLYAKSYTVTITYCEDAESGLADRQYYLLNGVNYEYDGSVICDKQMNYRLDIYALDNAGNRSDYVEINIANTEFDVTPPYVNNLSRSVDVTSGSGIYTVSFIGSDYGESGISSAYLETADKYFTKKTYGAYDLYSVSFDCYKMSALAVKVCDYAGNVTTVYTVTDYFSDEEISSAVKSCAELYPTIDSALYTETLFEDIASAYTKLNTLLSASGTEKADILSAAADIKAYVSTGIITSYQIDSVPDYASCAVNFTVSDTDFPEAKKGDTVALSIAKAESDGKDYVSAAGFEKGFSDYFVLTVTYNGSALGYPLETGLLVRMNMPKNYYDRNVALIDISNGEKQTATVSNNQIGFYVRKTSTYALVIEGGKAVTGNTTEEKTITVFGNKIKLSTFFTVVGVTGGIAAAAVAGIIVILVKKKK
jgi:hypothetical protein